MIQSLLKICGVAGLAGAVAALVVLWVAGPIVPSAESVGTSARESAYDRVVRTGELRCGYNYWEPGLVYDDKTQKLWGFYFDVMTAFEQESGIKVVWDHVVDWGNVRPELDTGRIDAMCAMWNTSLESRVFLFTRPFAYQTVEAIVRADDNRFDQDLSAINDPAVKIAVVDNATQDFIAKSDFPKAQRVGQQLLSSNAELLMAVETGKADVTFTNPGIFHGFDRANPGVLKRVAPGKAMRVYGNSLTLRLDDRDLANLLNVSFGHLINTGKIDDLVDRYNRDYPGTFMKPAPSFVSESER
jgi:ABC-type amino acid transport substrate-binding protein